VTVHLVCFHRRFLFGLHLKLTVVSTTPIDLHWAGHPRSIAAALLRSQDHAALVDPGPASTVSTLRQQLQQQGLNVSDLTAIFLTHIHLDHAAATGTLVRENPRLKVYLHARGLPHMVDPSKLLQSAARLYGDDLLPLFGEFLPVPAENLHALEGGEIVQLGSRQLRVLYTPGHASHHVTYFDPSASIAFVGDTTGICFNGHAFILPVTPPPDISIELWDASLDAIAALHPNRLFLTHFSFSDQPAQHIANYRESLHRWRDLSAAILAQNLDESAAIHRFAREIGAEATQFLSPEEVSHYLFNGALNLSWLGLARYHRKRQEAAVGLPG
jgi:glyoxylase-like metal-dependent hydrolase (beta-lactamase superfamily II)